MKKLLLTLITFTFNIQAQNILSPVKAKILLDEVPSFFFKVSSDGKYLSYSHPRETDRSHAQQHNIVINLETKAKHHVPGVWDPVFAANDQLIILPESRAIFDFYNLEETLTASKYRKLFAADKLTKLAPSRIYRETDLDGYYHSTGLLERKRLILRMIVEKKYAGLGLADYLIKDKKIEKIHQKDICKNQNIKLPMLSKDGQEIGALDLNTHTTGVFKIEKDFSCSKVHDFERPLGKMNFSYDSRYISFHVSKISSEKPAYLQNYIDVPSNIYVSDIEVYDREEDRYIVLTDNLADNSMYPDFTKEGDLAFLNHPHDKTKKVSIQFLDKTAYTEPEEEQLIGNSSTSN